MIIFNIGALLSATIAVLIGALLRLLFPSLLFGHYSNLTIFILILISGIIVEIIGLKPRLFFIPVSVIGFFGTAFQMWQLWHWYSIIISVVIAIMLFLLLKQLIKRAAEHEKQRVINYLNEYIKENNPENKKLLIFNAFTDSVLLFEHKEIIKHNQEVISMLLKDYNSTISMEQKNALESFLKASSIQLDKSKVETDNVKKITFEIKALIKSILSIKNEEKQKIDLNIKKSFPPPLERELNKANIYAWASIVLGLLSFLFTIISLVPGLLLAYNSLSIFKKHGNLKKVRFAKIALIINFVVCGLLAVIFIAFCVMKCFKII